MPEHLRLLEDAYQSKLDKVCWGVEARKHDFKAYIEGDKEISYSLCEIYEVCKPGPCFNRIPDDLQEIWS
jgi:hypothetical protein